MADGFFAGLFVGVCYGAPALVGVLYLVQQGLTPQARAERAYRRQVGQRTAEYIALGMHPYDAENRARKDMATEAAAALAVTPTC